MNYSYLLLRVCVAGLLCFSLRPAEAAVVQGPDYVLRGGGPSLILMHEVPLLFFDGSGAFVLAQAKVGEVYTGNAKGILTLRAHVSGLENPTGSAVRWNADNNPLSDEPLGFGIVVDADGDGIPDGVLLSRDWQLVVSPSGRGSLIARFTADDFQPFD